MKKLMIVAAVALAASFVNAASCNWSCESFGTYNNDASEPYSFKYAIIDLGTAAYTVDQIVFDGTDVTVAGGKVSPVVGVETADGWADSGKANDWTAGNKYAMVIFDVANNRYGVSDIVTATADTKPGATGLNPIAFMNTDDGINVDDDGTYAGIRATETIPEPTSGLLLLLGMAGLALRRGRRS